MDIETYPDEEEIIVGCEDVPTEVLMTRVELPYQGMERR